MLQQDAFDPGDSLTPMDRQKYMLDLVLDICDKEFTFDDYEKCRDAFKELINVLKQMNYSEFMGENFNKYRAELDTMLESLVPVIAEA